jgi:uncharacterized tellurite resistance protein B-like protein
VDQTLRRSLCRLIAGIVVADDDLDPAEDAFVDRLITRFGLAEEGRDAIFPIVDRAEASASVRALPRPVQQEALDLLIEASMADGKIVAEERAYLDAVAAEMGLSSSALQGAIDKKVGKTVP